MNSAKTLYDGTGANTGIPDRLCHGDAVSCAVPPVDRPIFETTDELWVYLATRRGVRLPYHASPCTTGVMRRWLRKLGLTVEWFYEYTDYRTLSQWLERNPSWTARQLAGLLLEEALP